MLRAEGEDDLRRANTALLWSGLAAGLSMGFSLLAMALLRSGLPDEPWRRLVDAPGYSVGFVIVVLGRQQLFTETTLTAVLPLMVRRDLATLAPLLCMWGIVLLAGPNGPKFVKAILAGWLIALMVWLLPSARSAWILVILLITYVVAIAQLPHIVAGSADVAYAVWSGHATVADYVWRFLVPTLLGNTVGGVALVAFLNHAPLAAELKDEPAHPIR